MHPNYYYTSFHHKRTVHQMLQLTNARTNMLEAGLGQVSQKGKGALSNLWHWILQTKQSLLNMECQRNINCLMSKCFKVTRFHSDIQKIPGVSHSATKKFPQCFPPATKRFPLCLPLYHTKLFPSVFHSATHKFPQCFPLATQKFPCIFYSATQNFFPVSSTLLLTSSPSVFHLPLKSFPVSSTQNFSRVFHSVTHKFPQFFPLATQKFPLCLLLCH